MKARYWFNDTLDISNHLKEIEYSNKHKIHPDQFERYKYILEYKHKIQGLEPYNIRPFPAFYCNMGGYKNGFFCGIENKQFKQWINTDSARITILEFGPYYSSIKVGDIIYPDHYPELSLYYEKYDKEYHAKYINDLQSKLDSYTQNEEYNRMNSWYKHNNECNLTPVIAKECVKNKLDEIITLKTLLENTKKLTNDRYKFINNITWLPRTYD